VKNYENPSIFARVIEKIKVAPFLWTTVYKYLHSANIIIMFVVIALQCYMKSSKTLQTIEMHRIPILT